MQRIAVGVRDALAAAQRSDRKPVQACSFDLPMPLSVNAIWMPGKHGGIIKTPAYRNWLSEGAFRLARQPKVRIEGSYGFHLVVSLKSRCDIDNTPKVVSDLLQEVGIITNDKLCTMVVAEFGDVDGMRVTLMSSAPKGQGRPVGAAV